jgi:glycosyltransferase involved in cell wall biosynthesis
VIAGDGPQRADLERLAQSSPVRILGYRRDVADLLAAADLFVLSSVGEGYPIAAVEAIAAGLPVVATRVGAVPEIVRDAGVLVDPSDVDGFVRAVGALAADASRRAELAARARAVVLPPPDELVARIGAVYDGVVT